MYTLNKQYICSYIPLLALHFTIMYHTTMLIPNVKTPRMVCAIKELLGLSQKPIIQLLIITTQSTVANYNLHKN